MKKNFTKVLLAAAAMTTIGLSYATNSGLLALSEEEEGEAPAEMVIDPAFISGEDEYTVNSHSAVVVPGATALKVNFENGPEVKYATYAIDMLTEEEGIVESIASGLLSINTVGYASFDEALTFVTGKQYVLTVKAWDVADIWEGWNMKPAYKVEEFVFNGGSGMGVIGEPVWGLDRFVLPGDMINIGVPVRFPSVALPYGIVAEDCDITVSATLVEVPANYGEAADDDDIDAGFGVQAPIVIKDAELHNANVEGGVVTAYLFPELMEEGKSYAIVLNAVTFINNDEIVAELPEEADYEVKFDVVPAAPQVTLGEPEWGIEAGVVTEDQINLGIEVRFPDAVLGEEVNPMEVTLQVSAMLYGVLPQGAEGGIQPLAETEDDENIDPDYTNRLLPLLDEPAVFVGGVEGGVLRANLFAECEELAVGNEYVIVLTDVKALCEEQPVAWMSEDSEWMTSFVVAELPEPADMTPELICGDENYALNTHSAVSIEQAEALAVKFQNAPAIRKAYYAIDRIVEDEATVSVAYGELSLNQVGYVEFEKPVVFIAGQQYKLTVKAFDTTDILDENLNLVEPMLQESYLINGAANVGVIGTPVFGIDRAEFPEDMIALGVPVRFPEMILPFGIQAEDCEITVSANLYGIADGNEPMPIAEDEDIDDNFGVDGPVLLQEVKLHTAQVVGGVVTAYLFPETLEVGNHYAIDLQAVTVIDAEGELIAELGEDDYFATDFVVTPYVAPIEFGQFVWAGIDENGNVDAEEANINGVQLTFPFANLGTEDASISVFATLYDITNMGAVEEGDDVDNMGVQGPQVVGQSLFFGGMNVETGVYEVALFPEVLEPAHTYVISVETVTAQFDDELILQWDNVEEECTVQFDVVGDLPAEMTAALLNGNDQVNLNGHAAASVETADAVLVRFSNAPDVKYATYAIDRVLDEETSVSMATGELSINTLGYATLEQPLVFVAGHQYTLTVKAWNTFDVLDENLNVVEPDLCEVYTFNGASATGLIGEPQWGVELGEEFAEDMINIGLPVRFPDMVLPFGVELEDCDITVAATLVEIPANYGEAADDDDIDAGFGVQAPIVIKDAELHTVNTEGGVVTAYLFPELMEAGKHYAVILNAVTVIDAEGEIVAELPEDADYEVEFTVAQSEGPTSIAGIKAENGKVMINLFGQKVNNANGVVILNGEKIMVK